MRMSGMDGAQVLVIDDDETIRAVLRRIVEMAGATVTEATTGEEGLRALYAGRPDVVVLDIGLPGLDGWQVLERIRQLTDLPVVMVSAHDDELEKVRALQAGADDYVTKPFGAPELLARLQVQVRRSRAASPGGPRRCSPTATPRSWSTSSTPRRPSTTGRSPSRRGSSGCWPRSSATRAARSAPSSSSTSLGTTRPATPAA